MKINAVNITDAEHVTERIIRRNADGWSLVGPIIPCLLNGGYTHYILTWEKEE